MMSARRSSSTLKRSQNRFRSGQFLVTFLFLMLGISYLVLIPTLFKPTCCLGVKCGGAGDFAINFGLGTFSSIETSSLIIYHGSLNNLTETSLEDPLQILPFLNRTRVTMIDIFGFSENRSSEDATAILSAYLSTQYTNVMLLDWSNEGKIDSKGAILSYIFGAAPNSRNIGMRFGRALLKLIQNGISANMIHLVGHSLGAHVAGYAGEYLKRQGIRLGRITGLDPAGPLFQTPLFMRGLRSSSAEFVDVLHTNPHLYGNINLLGTIDFFANCNYVVQPGCPINTTLADTESFCSHRRSYLFFAESILFPTAFPAVKADSCVSWQYQNSTSQIIYLGDMVDTSARGVFFFSTNSQTPYSKGRAGLEPSK